jgi:secreted trypsin-like serine protease
MKTHWRFRLLAWLFIGVAACATGSPALSLVGPAAEDQSFAAHVVMVLKGGVSEAAFCTGVVVAPQAVLTAAHCATAIENMRVYYRDGSGASQFVEVAAVAIHPGFRANALIKHAASIDLALIQTRAPLGARFSAAQLDETGAVAVGQALRIVGYGLGREGEGASGGVLRSALLQVRAPLSTILLWAEDPNKAGAGACSGDSGGPILSADGAKVLAITTWSAGAGRGKRCGAVTQGPLVAPQRGWIDSVLRKWRD